MGSVIHRPRMVPRLLALAILAFNRLCFAQAPATSPTIQPLTGRVLAPDGAPVPGANVSLHGVDVETYAMPLIGSVISDAQGRFSLPAAPAVAVLTVRAAGFGLYITNSNELEQNHPLMVNLRSSTSVRVDVVDTHSKPLPGVRVAVSSNFNALPSGGLGGRLPEELRDLFTMTTDASGAVTFSGMPKQTTVSFQITDPRYLDDAVHCETGTSGFVEALPLRAQAAATVRGRVIRADSGQPLAGVHLHNEMAGAVSDAGGNFTFSQLAPGRVTIVAELTPPLSSQVAARKFDPIELAPGQQTSDLTLKLSPGAILQGRLTRSDTHAPVAGAIVDARPRNSVGSLVHGYALTDADGRYAIQLVPGEYGISMNRLTRQGVAPPDRNFIPFTAIADRPANIDLQVDPNPAPLAVRGRIVDQQSHPVEGAQVTAMPFGEGMSPGNGGIRDEAGGTATTDPDGRFVIPYVTDGVRLRVHKGDVRLMSPVTIDSQHRELSLVIGTPPRSSMQIVVQDAQGIPLQDVPVLVQWSEGDFDFFGHSRRGYTGADGAFASTDLDSGYLYSIDAGGEKFTRKQMRQIRLDPAKPTLVPPIILMRADNFIAGTILDESGQPIAGADVSASMPQGPSVTTRSALDGRFRLNGIVASSIVNVQIRVGRDEAASQPLSVPAGTVDAVVVFHPKLPSAQRESPDFR